VPDHNGPAIVTGTAKYTTNVKVPGTLYTRFVRSPYGSAKIVSLDTSKAERMPGVVKIFTAKSPEFSGNMYLGDIPLITEGEVFFDTQPVAIVVGETQEAADDAADAVQVKYEVGEALTDVVAARDLNPPKVVHTPRLITPPFEAERPNVINCFYVRSGDIEQGFADADVVIEEEITTEADPHGYLVPTSAVARPEGDGTMTLWVDVQNIHPVPWPTAAAAAGIPLDKINVIGPDICSGGFGGKNCGTPGPYAAVLAKALGRPVRVVFDDNRLQHASRPWNVCQIKAGATNDGKFTAIDVTFNIGTPYAVFSLTVMERAREAITCTYHWGHRDLYERPNVMFTAYDSYANLVETMSYRGFGVLESTFPMETMINMLAEKLGMDRLEIRLINLVKEGERSAQNEIVRSVGSEGVQKKVYEIMQAWGPKPSVPEPWVVGRGFTGANKYSQGDMVHNLIFLKLRANGIVDIIADSMDIGQGMNTISRQFVAEAMNMPIENVRKVEVNTAYVPWTSDSFSSSATDDTGQAIVDAAKNAKAKLFEWAAPKLGTSPGNLETVDGMIQIKGNPESAISWGDAMAPRPHTIVQGSKNWPDGAPNDYDGPGTNDYYTGQALGPYFRLVMNMNFMAEAFEVMVNKETGEVKITKWCGGNDAIPVNPTTFEGQIIGGGLYHGAANAMYEENIYDNGSILTKTLVDWKMPTILDFPKMDDIHTAIVPVWGEYFGDNPRVNCPFGAKGIGEGVDTGSPSGFVDAIHDAIGVWVKHAPAASQKRILEALGKA
jgi:CO/xanthine dehydrogenase Mo-binding subunit